MNHDNDEASVPEHHAEWSSMQHHSGGGGGPDQVKHPCAFRMIKDAEFYFCLCMHQLLLEYFICIQAWIPGLFVRNTLSCYRILPYFPNTLAWCMQIL